MRPGLARPRRSAKLSTSIVILPAATCPATSRYASRSSAGESTKFEWPRIERPFSRTEPDVSVASGPADCPTWTTRARGAAASTAARIGSPHSGSTINVGPSPPHASRNRSSRSSPVEQHDLVGAQLEHPFELVGVPSGSHDPFCSEYPRGLNGYRSDGPRRAQDEHAVARLHGRTPCHGHPAGDPRDPAR